MTRGMSLISLRRISWYGRIIIKWSSSELLTNQITRWSRVLSKKLIDPQLIKKFPAFHEIRWFIRLFTSALRMSLSSTRAIQSMPPHPTSWRSILMLSSYLHLGLPSGIFPSGLPTKILYAPFLSPILATCHVNPILIDVITRIIFGNGFRL